MKLALIITACTVLAGVVFLPKFGAAAGRGDAPGAQSSIGSTTELGFDAAVGIGSFFTDKGLRAFNVLAGWFHTYAGVILPKMRSEFGSVRSLISDRFQDKDSGGSADQAAAESMAAETEVWGTDLERRAYESGKRWREHVFAR